MMTDPIADMLTRIRNAQASKKSNVEIVFSKVKKQIAEILNKNGYIGNIAVDEGKVPNIVLDLKYNGNEPAIKNISRVSKPGHRVYMGAAELPKVLNGYGLAIVSTSRGLMTDKEAREQRVGGEVICTVY